jgi:hypothetical protein
MAAPQPRRWRTASDQKLNCLYLFSHFQNSKTRLPNDAADDAIVAPDKASVKLRAASLATPPQSPPPKDEETLEIPQQSIQQRRTVSYPQARVPDDAMAAHASHIQLPQSAGDKITTPSVILTTPAHHALKSISAPSSPIAPPSALASALNGVGTALAFGSSSPRVHTSEAALSNSFKEGSSPPVLSITPPSSRIAVREGSGGGSGFSSAEKEVPHSPLEQPHDGEHDDHEEATIQRARHASVTTATFKTLNPAVGLDAAIERRSRPSSPVVGGEMPAPELVYYGSGANSEEEDDDDNDDDDEMPVEMFKSLNPHVSLEAEIARRSGSPSPVPEGFVAPQIEEDDGPTETFKYLNPAISLDAEILRRSRTPSPVPQFKELNEELSLEKEIAQRAASSPKPPPTEGGNRFADDANEAERGPGPVARKHTTPNRSLVRTTVLLPFILGLRMMNVFNPFTYLYLLRSRSRSTYPPEPYPKIPRSLLKMIVPAFIWRWAGKDPSYNLQRVGLGKGVNAVGTRYDGSGSALPPTSA